MNPRRFAGGCHTPPESACEAVSASAHVVAVHAGVSHPANSGRHASLDADADVGVADVFADTFEAITFYRNALLVRTQYPAPSSIWVSVERTPFSGSLGLYTSL